VQALIGWTQRERVVSYELVKKRQKKWQRGLIELVELTNRSRLVDAY
jgi:hypothetical protein